MMRKILFLMLTVLLLPCTSQSANKMFWATCLTGGGDCLDGISGSSISVGDGAIVVMDDGGTDKIYFYRVQASSSAESSPSVISPDTGAGSKRWHQVTSSTLSFLPLAGGTVTGAIKAPDGTYSDPSYSFSSETTLGIYRPGAGVISLGSNGFEGFRFDPGNAYQYIYGPTGVGGGTARFAIVPDEMQWAITDDGSAHGNQDICLYPYRNFNAAIMQNQTYSGASPNPGGGKIQFMDKWTSPSKTQIFATWTAGYPSGSSGLWNHYAATPDYSRLDNAGIDGWNIFKFSVTDTSGSTIKKNFMWGELSTGTQKFELDAAGKLFLAGGYAGDFTFNPLATPSAPNLETEGTAGSTTNGYKIVAVYGNGTTAASAETTLATCNAVLSSTNKVRIRASHVTGATSYKVYRTTAGGTPATTGLIGTITATLGTLQLYDTGLSAGGETPETMNTTGYTTWQGSTGGWSRRYSENTVSITANHTITLTLSIPTGAKILATQLRIDTALAAGETWNAAYSGGNTQTITHEAAVAKDTKINVPFDGLVTAGTLAAQAAWAAPITTATTNIEIKKHSNPGVDAFTAQGVIRAITYYEVANAMDNAP